MKDHSHPRNACVDLQDIAGGQQAESRLPEVEFEFAHPFIPELGTDAAVTGTNALAGEDGGRDR